ncbi:hypothetical protein PH30N_01881 [Cutibacterium modestum 30N]|nr:hypothetical protein [Cutibacterium modestum 30N]
MGLAIIPENLLWTFKIIPDRMLLFILLVGIILILDNSLRWELIRTGLLLVIFLAVKCAGVVLAGFLWFNLPTSKSAAYRIQCC